jgi:hypothetical protein
MEHVSEGSHTSSQLLQSILASSNIHLRRFHQQTCPDPIPSPLLCQTKVRLTMQYDRRPIISPRDGLRDGPRGGRTGFSSPPPMTRGGPPSQQNAPFNRTGPRPFSSPPPQNVRGTFGSPPGAFRPPLQQQGPSFQGGFGGFQQQRFPGPVRAPAPGPVRFPGAGPARPGFGPQARPGFGAPQLAPVGQFPGDPRPGFGPAQGAGAAGPRPQGEHKLAVPPLWGCFE